MSLFTKAVRKKAKLKVALTGPSGSGKTLSALLIARGLVGPTGRIAVIDTENDSASLYSGKVALGGGRFVDIDFDACCIEAPFTVEKYTYALKEAIKDGYDAVVIDSITHAWAGSGGLLEQKDALDARGKGNGYTNWGGITKMHEAFKEAILQADTHVLVTMRSKQDYILVQKGDKQVPQKIGMAPIQRDGMEYEFTLVLDIAMNHQAEVSKDRTSMFDGKIFLPTEDTGKALVEWLEGGAVMEKAAPVNIPVAKPAPKPTPAPAVEAPPPSPEPQKHSGEEVQRPMTTPPPQTVSGDWTPDERAVIERLDKAELVKDVIAVMSKPSDGLTPKVIDYCNRKMREMKNRPLNP